MAAGAGMQTYDRTLLLKYSSSDYADPNQSFATFWLVTQ